jgi:4-amino-4-deoxy-L-arabinose transferase-like glycosyltransferase
MALATLAKGPVGFILPLLVILCYLIIEKDWKEIKRMSLLPGMVIFMAIVLSWYVPAILKGGQTYFNETLLHHTLDRFAKGTSHIRPIYYYLYNFPVDFLPWVFFLPAAVAYGYSEEAIPKRKEFLFLFIWSMVIFLFFSISKGKRGIYLLPLFPATSLMVGKLWDDFIFTEMGHFKREWVSFPLYGIMGLTLIAGAAIPWVISMKFSSYLPYALPIAFLMVGSSLALFVLNRIKHNGAILFLIIGMMASGFFYTLRVVFPLVNPYKSARFISQEITSRIQTDEKLALYGDFGTGPYNFYTGIVPILELEGEKDLFHFLGSPERVFCLLKFRDFYKFQTMVGKPKIQLITRRKVGDDDIVLISNR